MKIIRFNADFGNSTSNFLVDGYYIECPTNVVELSKQEAERHFTDVLTDPKDLLGSMLLSTTIGSETKYFLVGEAAEYSMQANSHVGRMHDKMKSHIPYIIFLSTIAYYHALHNQSEADTSIEIESMHMMLPIWLLKREEKFSTAQNMMEQRFLTDHGVTIWTPGMSKELHITVHHAKCKIESEVARHAIKYKMMKQDEEGKMINIVKRREAEQFQNYKVVLVDIGGGSTDAVKLSKGLTSPKDRDSFQVIDIVPFLGYLEDFRKEKLLEKFKELRALETFIVSHYKSQTYKLNNENTGQSYDLTNMFQETLSKYAASLEAAVLNAFISTNKEPLKFIYIGGESPILEPYIRNSLLHHMTLHAAEQNHFFLHEIIEYDEYEVFAPTPRTINLCALEILSLNEMTKITI
ncbi:hypothetical protein [Ectobacillus polymachus]|uniref:Alp7A family actin-like protein n=1 Tax=Ectobacillus polymachus TaxID=1508806 RepID=UPI003A85EE23